MTSMMEKEFNFDVILEKLTNNFFYSTMCHICKKCFITKEYKQCGGCRMIAYCGSEHQRKHWPEHKQFCEAIQYVHETYESEVSACKETPKIMMEFLKEMVRGELDRRLKLYEVQMFKYPRMCFVCYKRFELHRCRCKAVWFCTQHKFDHEINACYLLNLCLKTDVLQMKKFPCLTGAYMKVPSYEEKFSDIEEFIRIYGEKKSIYSELPCELLEIQLSIHLTKPLTVIYGMRVLKYIPMYKKNKTELVLHIIAAHISDLKTLQEWEILLHMFPNLKCLKLVFIGSEGMYVKEQNVCNICNNKKKIFMVEWRDESYADYVQQCQSFKIPDLVIRFYIDNYYDDYYTTLQSIWKSSLKHIAQHKCPFLLCYSRKTNIIHKIINTELGKVIKYRCYYNPFASLKPCRKMDDDDSRFTVYYDNKYINVYESLCP